ncbi:MAG: type II toxin-antitoxin system VapC family toxin [Candidatus Njordarchaeota archaeon]
MVIVYVDTSVVIAKYKPSDSLYQDANRFFEKDYDFVISPITLMELYSVLARIRTFIRLEQGLENANVDTIIAFIVHDLKLRLVARSFMTRLQIFGAKIRAPLEYHLAIKFSEKLRLKTLDMLHVAYAYMLRKILSYFVTYDDDILKARKSIEQQVGIKIRRPSELV